VILRSPTFATAPADGRHTNMADSHATQAHAAMVDEEWDVALDLYSQVHSTLQNWSPCAVWHACDPARS